MSAISAFVLFMILNIQNIFGSQNFVVTENNITNIQIISEEDQNKEIDWLSEDEPKPKSSTVPKNNMLPFFIICFILFL